jgi:hypothetical protein
MLKRRPIKSSNEFQERLTAFAEQRRKEASSMPLGPDRADLLNRARQADEAAHVDEWARSLLSQPR